MLNFKSKNKNQEAYQSIFRGPFWKLKIRHVMCLVIPQKRRMMDPPIFSNWLCISSEFSDTKYIIYNKKTQLIMVLSRIFLLDSHIIYTYTILTKLEISNSMEDFRVQQAAPWHDRSRIWLYMRNIIFVAYKWNKYCSIINYNCPTTSKPSNHRDFILYHRGNFNKFTRFPNITYKFRM